MNSTLSFNIFIINRLIALKEFKRYQTQLKFLHEKTESHLIYLRLPLFNTTYLCYKTVFLRPSAKNMPSLLRY